MGRGVSQQDLLRHESRFVGGEAVALTLVVSLASGVRVIEDDRGEFNAEATEDISQVLLGGGAGLHADRAACQTFQRVDAAVSANHHALAVVEGNGGEVEAKRGIAADCPGGISAEDVDLTRLQDGEALVGRSRPNFNGFGVAQGSYGKHLAEVNVKALKFVGIGVDIAKTGHGLVAGTLERAAGAYRFQSVAGGGGRGGRRFGRCCRRRFSRGRGRRFGGGGLLRSSATGRQAQSQDG